jgi:hypothetical protein
MARMAFNLIILREEKLIPSSNSVVALGWIAHLRVLQRYDLYVFAIGLTTGTFKVAIVALKILASQLLLTATTPI